MVLPLSIDLEVLAEFLLRARLNGYAGDAKKTATPQRPGFKEFPPYREGALEYVDSYAGYFYAPGQEVIRLNGVPVWMMAYSGGMLPSFHGNVELAKRTFAFLQKALQKVDPARPFRGPADFREGYFFYRDESIGDITQFHGTERIFQASEEVFRQEYIGGIVVHKQ